MIRLLMLLLAALLLGGCASSSYHHRDLGGADYYYGDSYGSSGGYYDRDAYGGGYYDDGGYYYGSAYGTPRVYCSPYAWNPSPACDYAHRGWVPAFGYGYGGWSGWGYPLGGYHGNRWNTSLWLGFGSYATWGYAGFYNPWFGPWWPATIIYHERPRHSYRDRGAIRHEQVLQGDWRHRGNPSLAAGLVGATRYGRTQRQNGDIVTRRAPPSRQSYREPNVRSSAPRGRPTRGIPVNWPTRSAPVQRVPKRVDPVLVPRSRPSVRSTPVREIERGELVPSRTPSMPRSRPTAPRQSPDAVMMPRPGIRPPSSRPAPRAAPPRFTPPPTRPVQRSAPTRSSTSTRTRSQPRASQSIPVLAPRTHHSSAAPRGQPTRDR